MNTKETQNNSCAARIQLRLLPPQRTEEPPIAPNAPAGAILLARSVDSCVTPKLQGYEFGGNSVMVKGNDKVMSHRMFGILSLSADPLMRLRH